MTRGTGTDPLTLLLRMAAGGFDAEVQRWMQRAARQYLDGLGEYPLHECAQLPRSPHKLRLLIRDRWIAEAASQLGECLPASDRWTLAKDLQERLDRFLSAGPWRLWRRMGIPPAEAGALDVCLFRIALCNHGNGLTPQRLVQVIAKEAPDEVSRIGLHDRQGDPTTTAMNERQDRDELLALRLESIDYLDGCLDDALLRPLFAAARNDTACSVLDLARAVCARQYERFVARAIGLAEERDDLDIVRLDECMHAIVQIERQALAVHCSLLFSGDAGGVAEVPQG